MQEAIKRAFLGEQERFTWRHNSMLSYMVNTLKENSQENIKIFADLDGHNINGQTIPQDIIVTGSRPDLGARTYPSRLAPEDN